MGALSSLPPSLPLPFPTPSGGTASSGEAPGMGAPRHFPLELLRFDISQRKFPGSLSHAGILLWNPGSPTCDKNPEIGNQNLFPALTPLPSTAAAPPNSPFSPLSPRIGVPREGQTPRIGLADPHGSLPTGAAPRCCLQPYGAFREQPEWKMERKSQHGLKMAIIPSVQLCWSAAVAGIGGTGWPRGGRGGTSPQADGIVRVIPIFPALPRAQPGAGTLPGG